jgi:hypothetical protein
VLIRNCVAIAPQNTESKKAVMIFGERESGTGETNTNLKKNATNANFETHAKFGFFSF